MLERELFEKGKYGRKKEEEEKDETEGGDAFYVFLGAGWVDLGLGDVIPVTKSSEGLI